MNKSSISRACRLGMLLCLSLIAISCATVVKDEPDAQPSGQVKKHMDGSKASSIPVDWPDQEEMRRSIQRWEIRGRLGVQTEHDGGMMDLIWQQTANEFSIRLIAPLGAGTTLIQGAHDYATIRHSDGSKQTIENVDDLFRQALDVDLPASALKDWIRGLPASDMKISKRTWNKLGLIHRLEQAGWKIEMTEYTGTDIQMPHAIYLSHRNRDDIDIRLILKQWLID